MVTFIDSLVSSSTRPLGLRMRPDLTVAEHIYLGEPYRVVKEPIGLKYFRFQEEEYAILAMLDGKSSLEEIKERFEERYAPQKITLPELQHFVGTLHRSGLLIAEADQARQLKRRDDENRRKKVLGALSNVLAIRWRGIDPERLLNWLYPYTRWFFTRPALCMVVMLCLSALLLVGVQYDEFRTRLPSFHEFFGPSNWIYMGCTLAVVKVLHEFGHGLSCKRFGGECHEMGFMMLVFTPALYCNVSDSWLLPNKWHRAAIGAAGIYVEVTLASIATWLWWYSEPGLFNFLCLSVMFICSVSTIMFNGNPLLRFDGYYILADLIEIPNLRQKASTVLRRLVLHYCLGIEQEEDPFLPKRNQILMAIYTVAAVTYRWLVMFSIVMFLNSVLEPYGLKVVGQAIALMGLYGLVVQPLWQMGKFLHVPGRMSQVKAKRVIASLAVIGAVVSVVAFLPLPHYVVCSLEVRPRDASSVFVEVPGQLAERYVEAGQPVKKGDPLVRLVNLDSEMELAELRGQRDNSRIQFESLSRMKHVNVHLATHLEQTEETLRMLQHQLDEKEKKHRRLQLVAPVDGVVISPKNRQGDQQGEGRLPLWSGVPLSDENLGATLDEQQMLCQIGDPTKLEVSMIVDQGDIEFVRRDQPVRIKLESHPSVEFDSKVSDIARVDLKETPAALSIQAGGDLPTKTDQRTGAQRPISTSYQAEAPLEDFRTPVPIGTRGQAKIFTGWQPLGVRIWRTVARTFHFSM
ncbi:MAG: hemolysin D [Pirellulaceae bacterium]